MATTYPWLPLVIAYCLVMLVSLLALQFMTDKHFTGTVGDVIMVLLMSTGILLLVWVPFPLFVKFFPAICLAFLGAKLTRVEHRSGYIIAQWWIAFGIYFIGVSGIALY